MFPDLSDADACRPSPWMISWGAFNAPADAVKPEGRNPKPEGPNKGVADGRGRGRRAEGIKPHVAPITGRKVAGLDGRAHHPQQGLPDQSDHSQVRRADLWVGQDGGGHAPEPLLRGRAHRRGLQVGGLGAGPVALGQAERVAAAGRGAGVSPREEQCAQIQENA